MKKMYLLGIVFLLSVLAVSAGPFPDDDNDGICETPFCDQIDLCPKVACEQLGVPVEQCEIPDNTDTDGDGVGDVCDPCPKDRGRIQEPCAPRRRSSGGGGGGGSVGCRSQTDFNPQFHQPVGWQCVTDWDCQNTANKLGRDPSNYVCTVTERGEGTVAQAQNKCACSELVPVEERPAPPSFPITGTTAQQPVGAEAQQQPAQVQAPKAPPIRAGRSTAQLAPPQTAETGGVPGWVPGAVLLALGILLALVVYMQRKHHQ